MEASARGRVPTPHHLPHALQVRTVVTVLTLCVMLFRSSFTSLPSPSFSFLVLLFFLLLFLPLFLSSSSNGPFLNFIPLPPPAHHFFRLQYNYEFFLLYPIPSHLTNSLPFYLFEYSVFVGTGTQLCLMFLATLIFALFGLLSPANRGSLGTAFIFLFVFMGSFAGYSSSRLYKMFRGTDWKMNTLLTAFLYPGVVFLVFFLLNLVLWANGSSGALSFGTFFTLFFLWFCVSVPLVFLGSFFGYKRETVAFPVRTNQIPRSIPVQAWYMHPIITCLIGGVLPFGAVSVELYFIMSALWLHQIYYIFGFIFLVMIVLVTTCAEISILLCYFQLCNEDYRWWWRSFMSSGMYCTILHVVPYFSSSSHFLRFILIYCPYIS